MIPKLAQEIYDKSIQLKKYDERKLLFFYFDDDETPHLAAEQSAPEYGTIKKIYLKIVDNEQYLMVDYTE